jgi:hypothetical protein
MRPFTVSDRHDFPWQIDELVPGLTAMADDFVAEFLILIVAIANK